MSDCYRGPRTLTQGPRVLTSNASLMLAGCVALGRKSHALWEDSRSHKAWHIVGAQEMATAVLEDADHQWAGATLSQKARNAMSLSLGKVPCDLVGE